MFATVTGQDLTGQTLCLTGRHQIAAAHVTAINEGTTTSYVSLDVSVWQG